MSDEGDTVTSPLSEPSTCVNVSTDEGCMTRPGQSTLVQVCPLTTYLVLPVDR